MITLVWNKIVYIMEGDYYSVRAKLGIPPDDITPWSEFNNNIEWVKKFL